MYCTWKWSIGEAYYKSERLKGQRQEKGQEQEKGQGQEHNSQLNAINQSLADKSFFNQDTDLINITNTMFSRNQNTNETKREDLDAKIADREMIAQRGFNPFLQTSYVNDIVSHDMFLKPVNTTNTHSKETN
jgi:hypothetical protein